MASQAILEEKKGIVSEIVNKVKDSKSVIFFDYLGLTVAEVTELRRKLREIDGDYKVYKNTLTKRAMDELDYNLDDHLKGPSAVAFAKDPIAPAKILSDFARKHDTFKIKVGIVDGKISDIKEIEALASIPSREGLLTMLVGGMIQFVRDLSISLNLLMEQKNDGTSSNEVTKPVTEEVKEETEETTEVVKEEVNESLEEKENKEEE